MAEYWGFLLLAAGAAGITGLLLGLSSLLGPRKPDPVKDQPFETGVTAFEIPKGRITVKFFVAAVLFVILDVELVFLFPWALVLRDLGWFGVGEMGAFLVLVAAAFGYAWRKGAFQWT